MLFIGYDRNGREVYIEKEVVNFCNFNNIDLKEICSTSGGKSWNILCSYVGITNLKDLEHIYNLKIKLIEEFNKIGISYNLVSKIFLGETDIIEHINNMSADDIDMNFIIKNIKKIIADTNEYSSWCININDDEMKELKNFLDKNNS